MTMFARRFKRFMRSSKGRIFQKKEGLKIESTKEKDPIICYECKKLGPIKFDYPQLKKRGDEDSSDNEDQVVNLCLMVIDKSKVPMMSWVWSLN
ncbi:zf-CCHC domain-containing protein [Gossypium australe]|uniref:Zf-CCHC domain-containing protein n=1 Tax=Gossypium australe TaxID=47621 RepID=A0A5B6X2C2_9ROSI|nr:zf-CCHC domain-containing protein [Gossypium australe]